jgi:hypothetical protein
MTISSTFILYEPRHKIRAFILVSTRSLFHNDLHCSANSNPPRNVLMDSDRVNKELSNEYKIVDIQVATSLRLKHTRHLTTLSITTFSYIFRYFHQIQRYNIHWKNNLYIPVDAEKDAEQNRIHKRVWNPRVISLLRSTIVFVCPKYKIPQGVSPCSLLLQETPALFLCVYIAPVGLYKTA